MLLYRAILVVVNPERRGGHPRAAAAVALASGKDFDYKSPRGAGGPAAVAPGAQAGGLMTKAPSAIGESCDVAEIVRFAGCVGGVYDRLLRAALATPVFDPEQIKAILHTATGEENGFVTWVVTMVNRGAFPADLFESTLIWAEKKPHRNRFEYFKQALILRAAAVGIDLSHGPPTEKPGQRRH